MHIFAIGDLHLSGAIPKPMSIFGNRWEDHWEKIKRDWQDRVGPEDIVLVPGDISWAMTLEQAEVDLSQIALLPGRKILIRGNHDYWWSSISKVRRILPSSISVLQNDHLYMDEFVFCGTRGWQAPGTKNSTEHDQKIYARELIRLKLSLESIQVHKDRLIVLLHYPPFDEKGRDTPITELLRIYKPMHVVFGHLHGESAQGAIEGVLNDTHYHLTSCDYLDFTLKAIL